MSGDPVGNDVRKVRRARRLGPDAVCVRCGVRDPVQLIRAGRSLLEEHHVAGYVNDPALTVVVCRNCHAELSEAQRDDALDLRFRADKMSLERLEGVLRGLAEFFALLAESLGGWADELAGTVTRLDRDFSGWRENS